MSQGEGNPYSGKSRCATAGRQSSAVTGRPGGWRVQVAVVGGGIGKGGRVGACLALRDLVEFGLYSTYI